MTEPKAKEKAEKRESDSEKDVEGLVDNSSGGEDIDEPDGKRIFIEINCDGGELNRPFAFNTELCSRDDIQIAGCLDPILKVDNGIGVYLYTYKAIGDMSNEAFRYNFQKFCDLATRFFANPTYSTDPEI